MRRRRSRCCGTPAASLDVPWPEGGILDGYLRPDLPEAWHDFLEALLAAINDPAQAAALEQYALWRDTPALPLDAPWPDGP